MPAIDNHTHILPVPEDYKIRWNAQRPLGAPPYPMMVRLRVDNPEWLLAWRALYGYEHDDMLPEHTTLALQAKQRLLSTRRDEYTGAILDRANIAVALVNADALGKGQQSSRIRWVPYVDPLMQLPALAKGADGTNTDPKAVLAYAGVRSLPPTLDAYVDDVVVPTLKRWKAAGVPAAKVLAAYRRALNFAPRALEDAALAYTALRLATPGSLAAPAGGMSTSEAARIVEDHVLFAVARHAAREGIAIHIHTGNGVGPYFDNARANPLLLEPLLNDASLRDTRFVLVHGGWPYTRAVSAMIDKPNTYADISVQTFLLPAPSLAATLQEWLELMPEKVLFGTDAYSDEDTPLANWEEKTWLLTATARDALAIALTTMMRDGTIDRAGALRIARGVMHDNAARLYGLGAGR